jgi:alginate O-acetyltransferase complex protein AlgI
MVFASLFFLYFFLPPLLGIFFLVPARWKNFVLLAGSLFFYYYGEPYYIVIMIFAIFSGYLHGLAIDKYRGGRCGCLFFLSSVAISVGLLAFFKYAAFFTANFNALLRADLGVIRPVQPLGISFYTFQILSYTIDVYRGKAQAQKSLLNFALYVSFFPQLVAGPIVRYTAVAAALDSRRYSLDGLAYGSRRFIIGLAKKVLIANVLGELGSVFNAAAEKTVLFYWLYAISFSLQIYYDFSAYSDMAIGLGRIFGFHFPENFIYPYIARSITEFWRRWHISLGSWFRDYVYIPLGGSRVPKRRFFGNIIIVWFLTGFWHGAYWNFIVWGLFFAFLLILEKQFLLKLLQRTPSFLAHFYVIFCVVLSFVMFNASGVKEGLSSIAAMFGLSGIPFTDAATAYYLRSYAILLLMALMGATPLFTRLTASLSGTKLGGRLLLTAEPFCLAALLLAVTAYLVDGSFNPFLYFRF